MATKVTTVAADKLLKDSVALTISISCWGNRRLADMNKVTTTDTDKRRLKLTKQLIESKDYEELKSYLNEMKQWMVARSMPFIGFKKGVYLAKLETVDEIEKEMPEKLKVLDKKIRRFIDTYEEKVTEAEKALGALYDPTDYPSVRELPRLFFIDWNWIAFSVPENLPEELKKKETAKLKKKFEDAGTEIIQALRSGFQELIAHAIERLTPDPKSDKPKIFKDTTITNINAFIDTFNARNLMNDGDLQAMVDKARNIVKDADPDKLRESNKFRTETVKAFATIKKQVDEMIIATPTRKFEFDN